MTRKTRRALKVLVWGICLSPLGMLVYQFWTDDLGANPISYVTNVLGDTTLRVLLASLAMTPLRLMLGISWQMSFRRLLGLFAFFYAVLHFTVWIAVDHFFAWPALLADIRKRPYITVGFTALVLLMPLAATSTTRMVKRLGGRNWQRLHRLVYVIGILAILHFLWLAKKGRQEPFYYAVRKRRAAAERARPGRTVATAAAPVASCPES
ncbi:MAG: sulfoxide reductase heme-binding subunit YedZ [Candidatus Rokuibacteriota bacterium]|nr:MAG: sulfoxide reductase heme-binding subunit YedZ [Candidatus Rokubacteria bacterium]